MSDLRISTKSSMCEKLDDSARAILFQRAALFGLKARIEADYVLLRSERSGLQLKLPLEVGLCRVVAELAGMLTPWVIFSEGKPPEAVLIQLGDLKYRKLILAWEASQAASAC